MNEWKQSKERRREASEKGRSKKEGTVRLKNKGWKEIVVGKNVRFDNWASEASPTLGCSIEISRVIYICACVCRGPKSVGGNVGQMHACSMSVLGGKIRPVTPVLFISTIRRAALAWMEEKRSLRNEKLKANRTS